MQHVMLPEFYSTSDQRWILRNSDCLELFLVAGEWPDFQQSPPSSEFGVHQRPPYHGEHGCLYAGALLVNFMPAVECDFSPWARTQELGAPQAFEALAAVHSANLGHSSGMGHASALVGEEKTRLM
ncbi:hypothetical protein GE09DRAFT_1056725 [Coniochaeta sp. 2T2.1]|nr:hypothetical protein GE09DRAFT_1056725 [Coniochaeta sp. 2T2.1]